MILRQNPVKPLLGQEIEHFGGNVECFMSLHASLWKLVLFSLDHCNCQSHTFQPCWFLVQVLTITVALGFSTVSENTYFDFAFLLQLC